MGELLAVTCDSCGEPMVLGREHAGRGRGGGARPRGGRARPGARAGAGRSRASPRASARTGAPGRRRGRPRCRLNDALAVSYHSDDFAEAQDAKQALAAVGALCGVLRRTAGDAQEWVAGIDTELPGLRTTGDR